MAKWGEGDPRWIVEARPDATNVNNWHWSEKDASKWSRTRLTELLKDLAIETDGKRIRVNEVDITGEAFVNNRKAKLIFLYDWKISGKWDGVYVDDVESSLVSGELEINGLSDENDVDEIDVVITTTNCGDIDYAFKNALRLTGIPLIKRQLECYLAELKTEFPKGLIKPVSTADKNVVFSHLNNTEVARFDGVRAPSPCSKASTPVASTSNVGLKTRSVNLRDTFKCDAIQLFDFLTQRQLIEAWTKAPVEWELSRESRFCLFDGNVTGVVVDFIPASSLKLRWRISSWPEEHFSNVKINLEQREDSTELILEQNGVPDTLTEATSEGWKLKTFQAIKAAFGVGAYNIGL